MDYKNNKRKSFKKKNSNSSFLSGKSPKGLKNIITIDNNIKAVDSKMSGCLNDKIKIIKKKTMNTKRKTPFFQKLNKKNTKNTNNNSINSSNNSINNSNFFIKSLNEDIISKLNKNKNNNLINDDIT